MGTRSVTSNWPDNILPMICPSGGAGGWRDPGTAVRTPEHPTRGSGTPSRLFIAGPSIAAACLTSKRACAPAPMG